MHSMNWSRIADSAAGLVCALITLFAMVLSVNANRQGEIQNTHAYEQASYQSVISDFRFDRECIREMESGQLIALSQDENADAQIRTRAQSELMELYASMEAEATIEEVLFARGHEDAVVTVHPGSVNVVIKSGYDNKAESAFILDLVMRETGQSAGNIKIITVDENIPD